MSFTERFYLFMAVMTIGMFITLLILERSAKRNHNQQHHHDLFLKDNEWENLK